MLRVRYTPGTARSRSGSTPSRSFEKLVRVPLLHRRRAAGARLAAAPGRSSCEGMRVMGLDELLEQLREEMRERYRDVQPATTRSTRCAQKLEELLDLEREALDERRPTTRSAHAQARASSTSCRRACPRRSSSSRDYEFEDDEARGRLRGPARRAREHPRPRGVPAPLRRSVPRAARRSTTSEALELMREMERLEAARGAAAGGQPRGRRPRRSSRELLGAEARAGLPAPPAR